MFSVSLRDARQVSWTYQEKVLPCISPSVLPALRLADSGAPSRKLAKPNPVFGTKLEVWFGEKATAAVRLSTSIFVCTTPPPNSTVCVPRIFWPSAVQAFWKSGPMMARSWLRPVKPGMLKGGIDSSP